MIKIPFRAFVACAALLGLLQACGDGGDPPPSLPRTFLSGVARDSATQLPIANVRITTLPVTEEAVSGTDGAWTLEIKERRSGIFTVRAVRDGYRDFSTQVQVEEGQSQSVAVVLGRIPLPARVAFVEVDPATASLPLNGTLGLSAVVRDSARNALSGRSLTWRSSDPNILTVSGSGLVTAVAAGTARAIASSESIEGSSTITIVPPIPITSVELVAPSDTVDVLDSMIVSATARAEDGTQVNREISFASTNSGAGTITRRGSQQAVFRAIAPGVTELSAAVDGVRDTRTIVTRVRPTVATVRVMPDSLALGVGDSVTITADVRDETNAPLSRPVRWSSTNPSVVQVDSVTGRVRAIALGTSTVSATADGRTGTARVFVVERTAGIAAVRVASQPTQGRATVALTPGFTVELVNGAGEVVSAGDFTITAQLQSSVAGYTGSLSGTPVKATQAGRAVFDDLRVTVPGVYSVRFSASAPGVLPVNSTPFIVDDSSPLVASQLSAGGAASCAVSFTELWCWGSNANSRIGPALPASASFTAVAVPVSIGEGVAEVIRGPDTHTCARAVSGRVFCWGGNSSGKAFVSTGTSTVTAPREVVLPGASRLALGEDHTCVLYTDNSVGCVGENSSGQLGTNGTVDQFSPTLKVVGGLAFSAITAGFSHTCGLVSGNAYCWGNNFRGSIGNGSTVSESFRSPQLVAGNRRWIAIASSNGHTCAIEDPDRSLHCWGANVRGQLGDGTVSDRGAPQRVLLPGVRFVQVTTGDEHTCALAEGGQAYCWGQNGNGRLGRGFVSGTTAFSTPAEVIGPKFKALSAGDDFTCGIAVTDAVWCWGAGLNGRLGGGATASSGIPLPVVRR